MTLKRRWQLAAFCTLVVAVTPYVLIKIAWLAGSDFGMKPGGGVGEMGTPRFVTGNIITIGMDVLAVVLGLALIQPWGRRVPGWLVLIVAGGATGLLAPILLGLPLGSLLQLAVEGNVSSGGEGNLEGWTFAIIYGGFGLMALALAVLLALYADHRWGTLLAAGVHPPEQVWVRITAGTGMLGFAAAMLYWGIFGPGTSGPLGMEAIAQRTVLVVTGIAALGGFLAPLLLGGWTSRARLAALVTWVGCAAAALQGPAGLLLAHGGAVTPLGAVVAAVGTPAAVLYGLAVLASTRRAAAAECPQGGAGRSACAAPSPTSGTTPP